MYTIKRAAELTGLSVATLRAWERRYGIVAPRRTDAGYRLYDAAAVQALSVMNSLVLAGWSARQAAEETRRRLAGPAPASGPAEGASGGIDAAPAAGPADGPVEVHALVAAAARLDAVAVAEVLDDAFSRASFERVVDDWLLDSLIAVGEAWEVGDVGVAGEHLVSYAVSRRLSAAYEAAAHGGRGPRVVVGLPPGARHELGLLAFATAARRQGLSTAYLGADVPAEDWPDAVATQRAGCVVLAVPSVRDVRGLRSVVASLRQRLPQVTIAVGGGQQDRAPAECIRLGHEIGPAAALLASLLRGREDPSGG
ncbi:MerR family transcriptional regulator [Intrasporangium sp.]|uniref:MerR family transcriptional regulator n=1 Tax=Intrasporangium sp. TaxID=1925024 RepID=UPI002D78D7AE|nr:MerR family transcriptional regulator [Intrasporangium sp.]